jgi:DNA-binding transcriptional ArsR family regulator
MPTELEQRALALRLALIDGDSAAADVHQNWLMGEVATGLLYQDAQTLTALGAALADLPPLADRYGDGRKGDRWRAVWELVEAIGETVRPLEQVRLARGGTYTGEVLRLILDEPGITPKAIVERTGRQPNHVSNTLRALLDQGLVYRLPQGRSARYFAEASARELAGAAASGPAEAREPDRRASPAPPSMAPGAPANDLPHVGAGRLGRAESLLDLPGAGAGASRTRAARRRAAARPDSPDPSARREASGQ